MVSFAVLAEHAGTCEALGAGEHGTSLPQPSHELPGVPPPLPQIGQWVPQLRRQQTSAHRATEYCRLCATATLGPMNCSAYGPLTSYEKVPPSSQVTRAQPSPVHSIIDPAPPPSWSPQCQPGPLITRPLVSQLEYVTAVTTAPPQATEAPQPLQPLPGVPAPVPTQMGHSLPQLCASQTEAHDLDASPELPEP